MMKLNNLKKADSRKWKRIADTMLYSLPGLSAVIITMPVSDNTQKWSMIGLNLLIVGFKAISKFTTDEESIMDSSTTTDDIQSVSNTEGDTVKQ